MNEHLLQIQMQVNTGEIVTGINNVENGIVNMINQVKNLSNTFKRVDTNSINADLFKNVNNMISETNIKADGLSIGMQALSEAFRDAAEGSQQMLVLDKFEDYIRRARSLNDSIDIISDSLKVLGDENVRNLSGGLLSATLQSNEMLLAFESIVKSANEAYTATEKSANAAAKLAGQEANVIDPTQVKFVSDLDIALSSASKRIGQITDKNAEYVSLQKNSLELAIKQVKNLAHLPDVQSKIGKAGAVIEALDRNILLYKKNTLEVMGSNLGLIELIVKSDTDRLKLTKDQASNLRKLMPMMRGIKALSVDIQQEMGLTQEQFKKINEFSKKVENDTGNIVKESLKWKDLISGIQKSFQEIDKVVPGFAQFGHVLSPLKMIGDEIRSINSLYEKNATVNAVFMKGMYDSYNATAAMAEASFKSAEGLALLGETQIALTAIINSGQAAAVKSSESMNELAESVAVMSRITGISTNELADLQTRLVGLHGSLEEANKLSNVFINIQANGRLSVGQMGQMASLLTRDLGRLDRAYQIVNANGEMIMSGTAAIAAGMGSMAEEAAKAGGSSQAALDLMTRAIQNPISQAALLGPALMESDPSKQFLMMGERAHMFHEQMKNLPPAIQAMFAQKLGTTPQELESLSKATKDYREALSGASDEAERQAITERFATQHREKAASETEAAAKIQEAYESSTRRLENAFDSIRIIFSRVAAALQPILNIIAALMENAITRWILIAAGAALTLYAAVSKISKGLTLLRGLFGGVGESVKKMVTSAGGEGKGFVEWIQNFITKLGEIPIVKALKAALVLVLVGAALAAGVAMMGLALNLMPPDKGIELAVAVGGIVAAAYVLTLMSPIIKPALVGALGLILVGAALAIGIAMIGLASNLLDPNRTEVLLVVIGGLLAAMVLCAAIGALIVPALIGAAGMIAVASALAISIMILSTVQGPAVKVAKSIQVLANAVNGISIRSAVALGALSAALIGFIMTLTGAGILNYFVDFISVSRKLANALDIIAAPVSRLTGLGNAANVLVRLSEGLSKFGKSLDYGGWFSSIPDFVDVANRLANAINRLLSPINNLSGVGLQAGTILKGIGEGLSVLAGALDQGNWFTPDFDKHAKTLSRSLSLILGPVRGFSLLGESAADTIYAVSGAINTLSTALSRKIDSRNIETLSRAVREISNPLAARMTQATEEIRSNLAIEIESSITRKEDMIIERLEEIRDAVREQEDGASIEELKLMNKTLKSIADEMSMSEMAGTVADTRYNC